MEEDRATLELIDRCREELNRSKISTDLLLNPFPDICPPIMSEAQVALYNVCRKNGWDYKV